MKKTFRRALSMLCALAMVISCLSASMFAFAADNLALGATVIVDSVHNEWGSKPETVNDGNIDTRWQSGVAVGGTSEVYVGLVWGTPVEANRFYFYWEASAPGEDYEIYIATSPVTSAETQMNRKDGDVWTYYTEGNADWTKIDNAVRTRSDAANIGATYEDKIVLNSSETIYAVKFVCKSADNDKNKNMSCREIKVYNFDPDKESPESSNLSYVDNIILGSDITASSQHTNGDGKVDHPASNAIDANINSYWETASDQTTGEWIIIDLKEIKEIASLRAVWGGAEAKEYTLEFAGEDQEYNTEEFIKTDKTIFSSHHEDKITLTGGTVNARYIRLTVKSGTDKTSTIQLWEIEAFGPVMTAASSYDITLQNAPSSSKRDICVATNVVFDEISDGCFIKAEYTITLDDGRKATGYEYITSAYKTITLGDETVDASAIKGANITDYVTCIIFTNVPANATVYVKFTPVNYVFG